MSDEPMLPSIPAIGEVLDRKKNLEEKKAQCYKMW